MLKRFSRLAVALPTLAVAVAASTAGAWLLGVLPPGACGGTAGPVSPAGAAPAEDPPEVVLRGYADMEGGVAALNPAAPGRVLRVEARENERVRAGAVLVQLDDRAARLRVRLAEADLKAARERLAQGENLPGQHRLKVLQQQAAVDAAGQRLRQASLLLGRRRQQLQRELVNPTDVQATEAAVEELKAIVGAKENKLAELRLIDPQAEVEKARADVEARQAQLDLARDAVEECRLKAPQDGVVLRVRVAVGDVIGPQSPQPAVQFCLDGKRIVRAEVEQEFASRVAAGRSVWIQDDTRTERRWSGTITHVSDWFTHRRLVLQEPLQFNDVRTLECIIALDPEPSPPRINQRLRVLVGR